MPSAPHPTYAMCMRPRRVTYTCECVPWNCCWRLEVIHWRKNFPERKKIFIPFIRYSLNLGKYYLPSINIYHFRHSYICIREGSHALKCNYIFREVLYAQTHLPALTTMIMYILSPGHRIHEKNPIGDVQCSPQINTSSPWHTTICFNEL